MVEPTITCPSCKKEIKLTESLTAPVIEATRREMEQSLIHERKKIKEEEVQKAKQVIATDMNEKNALILDLESAIKTKNKKLEDAQKSQAEVLRKQRELDDAKREIDLTIEQRVQKDLVLAREKARKEAEDAANLKVIEQQQTILSMQTQIDALKRKSEQGSQQLQGEAQELQLEAFLMDRFPRDQIHPVPKGEFGGDVVQRIFNNLGQSCGTILWESKRTKNWSDGWLLKLREDQRAAKADIAIIVSQALPKNVETFDWVDGVWVTNPQLAIPVAMVLRSGLLEIASARQATQGQHTKMEQVYKYLTGPIFRQRIEALVENFSTMQDDLQKEKKVMTRQWAKREAQLNRMMESTSGMYGDFQGIAANTLQEIDGLEFHALEGPEKYEEESS